MQLLDQLVAERDEISTTQTGLVERAAEDARDLTDSEDTSLKDLKTRADVLDARIAELREIQVSNLEAAKLRAEVASTDDAPEERAAGRVTITDEPLTYRAGGDHHFLQDMFAAQVFNDPVASQRIARHQGEMDVVYRAGTTANYAGLVVPQYLTALVAEKAQAGRPFANMCRSVPLPFDGMTVNISRVTTSSSAAAQSSENSSVSSTDIDDTLLTSNVRTYAGQQDISRQVIERGTMTEEIIFEDLAMSYATSLDADLINGSGSSGTHTGILNTSGIADLDEDDASPTGKDQFEQIVKAIGTVNANRFLPPDVIVVHPRRAAYLAGSSDTTGRPLFQVTAATSANVIGIGGVAGYGGALFQIAGVPVVTDANIPTNLGAGTDEDRVITMRSDDVLLFEQNAGTPMLARFDGVGSATLTVRIVAFGYSAFAVRNPSSVAVNQGSLWNATL